MNEPPARIVAFLARSSAGDTAHRADRSLLAHLLATWRVLDEWQAPRHVRTAGLIHSVYGTDAFDVATVAHDAASRAAVRAEAGAAAEALAYAFCAIDRERFLARPAQREQRDRFTNGLMYLKPREAAALAEILLANELDLAHAKKGGDPRRIARKVAPVYAALAAVLPQRVKRIAARSGFGG